MSRALPNLANLTLSVFMAMLVSVFPLPHALQWYRPEFMALLIIYWVLHFPQRVGIGLAWLIGLALDIVEDGVWGANALAFAVIAYVCLMSYRRLRSYTLTQQTAWVFVFIGIYQLFYNWVQSLDGVAASMQMMLISNLITATCWPILILCLSRFGVDRA